MNNEHYWLIKYFDNNTLDHIRNQFDKESGIKFIERFNQLNDKISALQHKNSPPEDSRVQALAKEFWQMVMEFTNGDMSILPKLIEFSNLKEDNEWFKKQATINEYIQPALQLYFKNSNVDPSGE